VTHLVDHLLAAYGYWTVVLMVGLESLGIPMPGETALITASIYAGATHNLSILLVVLAAISGAIAGDNVGFAIGHWGGYRLLVRYGKYVRLNEARIKLGHYVFLRHGGKVVFFGRFVSVLRTYAALLAGTTRMPWWRFLAFNAAGGIVWACIYGLGAYFLGAQLVRLTGPATVAVGITAAIVIVAFFVFVRRNENRLEAAAERALPGPLDRSDRNLPIPPGRDR
jgi:membrane protein DedA with SNARE-associated domain